MSIPTPLPYGVQSSALFAIHLSSLPRQDGLLYVIQLLFNFMQRDVQDNDHLSPALAIGSIVCPNMPDSCWTLDMCLTKLAQEHCKLSFGYRSNLHIGPATSVELLNRIRNVCWLSIQTSGRHSFVS